MGLVHGVPEGGTVWEVPSARSAHAREARFFASIYKMENKALIIVWIYTIVCEVVCGVTTLSLIR